MTVNQVMCPDCGRPPGIGRETCAACGAILDPAARAAAGLGPGRVDRGSAPTGVSMLADLPFAAPSDAGGKVVAIGAWVAAIGFLLPWSNLVIGAEGAGGYINSWGLATITHLPVLLFALAVGLVMILPRRPAPWLTGGMLPVVLGGLLLGLAWPYLVGGLGGQVGLFVEALAAIAMIVGGGLRLAPGRNDEGARTVS